MESIVAERDARESEANALVLLAGIFLQRLAEIFVDGRLLGAGKRGGVLAEPLEIEGRDETCVALVRLLVGRAVRVTHPTREKFLDMVEILGRAVETVGRHGIGEQALRRVGAPVEQNVLDETETSSLGIYSFGHVSAGEGYTVNIPLPGGLGDGDYAHAFSVLSRLDEIGAEMTAMIELMTGEPPSATTAERISF